MKSFVQTPSRSWSDAYKTASVQGIIGYDANPLYLPTMLTDLLCVKEKVVQYQNPAKTAPLFTEWLKAGTWFGFAEVDIKISKHLWIKFEKKKPFFFTKQIPDEAVPQHIKDYCEALAEQEVTRKIWLERCQCKCCSFLTRSCVDMWNNGQSPTVIHCTIDYQATKNFAWFVEQVTEVRRTGDVDKRKGLLANVFRLLENSSYRKLTY